MNAPVLLSIQSSVARITLNRPERLNAFNVELFSALFAALDTVEADRSCRALVLTGAGTGFCAGQDLEERRRAPESAPIDLGVSTGERYNPLIKRLAALPLPVVAAVNGVAAGAGANLVFACDIVIAARSAKFIEPFVRIGLAPDAGGSWHLPRLAGQARALGMALTATPVAAEQAAEWGLIWACVADDRLDEEVDKVIAALLAASPAALAATKRALRDNPARSLEEALDVERDTQRRLGFGADYAEGVAAFLSKRQPCFGGNDG